MEFRFTAENVMRGIEIYECDAKELSGFGIHVDKDSHGYTINTIVDNFPYLMGHILIRTDDSNVKDRFITYQFGEIKRKDCDSILQSMEWLTLRFVTDRKTAYNNRRQQ